MFYGEYEHTIDKKGRLIVPSRFTDSFKEYDVENLYITRGLDRCLFVFTENEWKSQESKFRSISFTKSESRKFNRIYFAGAARIECDKQGRILIPKYLKDYAGIKRDVMIIGVSNRIEVWSKDEWQQYYNGAKGSFEDIAEKLMMQEGA